MKSARCLKAADLWISGEAWERSGSGSMRTAVAPRSWGVASQAVDAKVSIISNNDCTFNVKQESPVENETFP